MAVSGPVFPYSGRIDSVFFPKAVTEVGKILEAHLVCHLGDIQIGFLQQLPGPVEPERIQVIDDSAISQCLEFPVKLGAAHGHNIADLLDAETFISKVFLEGFMEFFHETILHAEFSIIRCPG